MAKEVVMPQLGLTMTEGTVVRWIKQKGDKVAKGEPLFEVETDKVVQEVTSMEEGTLSQIVVGEGQSAPIGAPIAYVTAEGETFVEPVAAAAAPEMVASQAAAAPSAPAVQTRAPGEAVKASPAAKKLAEKMGVDISVLKGTGPGGRVVEDDVRKAASAAAESPSPTAAPAVSAAAPAAAVPTVAGEKIVLKGVRKVVAERMALSFSTAPHFYLTVEVDAEPLLSLRKQIKPALSKKYGVEPTVTDLLVKAVAIALREFPDANSSWAGDGIVKNADVNVGIAASSDGGLVVPVVPKADKLPLGDIAKKRASLVEKARAGQLTLAELEGGTFTLSNLGMFGVDQFQAIVNPPQAAILAVGRAKDRAVVEDGEVAVKKTMFLTLSIDHRVMDGAEGAKFLARVVGLIEEPFEMLLSEGGA